MAGTTRRFVLATGAAGAALLGLGAVGLALRPGATHRVPEDLQALDARAFRTLEAFAARVCPGEGPRFPSAGELGIARLVDAHVATLHPNDQRELNQALWLLENALAGAVLEGRTTPFSATPPGAQDRAIARWRESSIGVLRQAYRALHGLVAATYYGHPRLRRAVGYPGPPNYGQSSAPAIQPAQQLGAPS